MTEGIEPTPPAWWAPKSLALPVCHKDKSIETVAYNFQDKYLERVGSIIGSLIHLGSERSLRYLFYSCTRLVSRIIVNIVSDLVSLVGFVLDFIQKCRFTLLVFSWMIYMYMIDISVLYIIDGSSFTWVSYLSNMISGLARVWLNGIRFQYVKIFSVELRSYELIEELG